jgi:staphylococcal nuclease domain-containing protein 1
VYERLLELEEMAKGAKRGIHSSKEVPTQRVNDVSLPGNAARAKQVGVAFTMVCVNIGPLLH